MKINTPELDKMLTVQKESQVIADFLEWLQEEGLAICKPEDWHAWAYNPIQTSREELLAWYFEIDLNKAEKERRAILDHIRANNGTDS